MGRLSHLMIAILAVNIGLYFFSCSGAISASGQCIPNSDIWTYLLNPQEFSGDISSTNFWDILFGTAMGLAGIASAALLIGSFFFRTAEPLFIGIALAMVYQTYSLIKVYQQVQGSAMFGSNSTIGTLAALILIGPIILIELLTLIEWAGNRY